MDPSKCILFIALPFMLNVASSYYHRLCLVNTSRELLHLTTIIQLILSGTILHCTLITITKCYGTCLLFWNKFNSFSQADNVESCSSTKVVDEQHPGFTLHAYKQMSVFHIYLKVIVPNYAEDHTNLLTEEKCQSGSTSRAPYARRSS